MLSIRYKSGSIPYQARETARWFAPAMRKVGSVVVEAKPRAFEINEDTFRGCDGSASRMSVGEIG